MFIWLLINLFSPVILMLFWQGATFVSGTSMSISSLTSYFLFLTVGSIFLIAHCERQISVVDIKEGGLSRYLLKPYPYVLIIFLSELAYRMVQGVLGMIVFGALYLLYHSYFAFTLGTEQMMVASFIVAGAYLMSFIYKFIVGMSAFWVTEASGILQFSDMVLFLTAGFLGPFILYPDWYSAIVHMLPFAYMLYVPVISAQGVLDIGELFRVLSIQVMWIVCLIAIAAWMWKRGVRRYTGVGI